MLGGFSYKEPKKWLYDHKFLHSGDSLPAGDVAGENDELMVIAFSEDGTKMFGQAQEDDPVSRQGAVYEAVLKDGTWQEVAKITGSANVGEAADRFGESGVCCFGDKLFVSAIFDNDNGTEAGALFVFHSSSAGWQQVQKLFAAEPKAGDRFGARPSISADGQTLIVGASAGETTGGFSNSGVIHVFQSSSNGWEQVQEFPGSTGGNALVANQKISADGTRIVAGSSLKNEVYVFDSGSSGFQLVQTITPSDSATGGRIGQTIQLSPDGSRIITGNTADSQNGSNAGAVYYFQTGSSGFEEVQKILPNSSQSVSGGKFGESICYIEKVTGLSTLRTIAVSATGMLPHKPVFIFRYNDETGLFVQYQEIIADIDLKSNHSNSLVLANRGLFVEPNHGWLAAGYSFWNDDETPPSGWIGRTGVIGLYKWSDEY